MVIDYIENIVQLLATITALLMCLFRYISRNARGWIYGTIIFLSSLLSCYYWTSFFLITGGTPDISNLFSYIGWDVAFAFLLVLVIHVKTKEERRYFNPLMLLPVPLNIWQLTLYLPYGGVVNSIYQVAVMTAVACFSIQSLLWYLKKKNEGARRPYVAGAALLYAICEFGMWTCSCFYSPGPELYYVFSLLNSGVYLLLVLALAGTYHSPQLRSRSRMDRKYQIILKASYFASIIVCCAGGVLLGIWLKKTLAEGVAELTPGSELNKIIPVVLFLISMFMAAFAIVIIFIVTFSEKVSENNRLREARLIAERSSDAKTDFLANMSHEIRTPINAVLGMNEMILRESGRVRGASDPEELRRGIEDISGYAAGIRSAGGSLLSIINDVLDFSKIDAGMMEINESEYSLGSLLCGIDSMMGFRAREKGLGFRIEADPSLPDRLRGDEVRVRQVLTNLLNNAIKYTKEGSVSLAVSREPRDGPEADSTVFLRFTVKDTGIGIRREDMEKLFQKFQRVDLEQNSSVEGTGLGLAITYCLLDMMGGTIDVDSEYGKGSVFTVTIPQEAVSEEPIGNYLDRPAGRSAGAPGEPAGNAEPFTAPDARILIVDDTRMNLAVLSGLLKKTGVTTDTASSGAEAAGMCRSRKYDLILMDQRMPQMSGTEAMRYIRAQQTGANRDTPFVCLTADAVAGARERYLAEGFADYLSKPVTGSALEQVLIKHLPKDKIIKCEAEQPRERPEEKEKEEEFGFLRNYGADPDRGLMYCQGDAGIYRTLLLEYAGDAEAKTGELERCLSEGNWKEYAVHVHAIKSTSKMIGAGILAEEAAELEAAADEGNAGYIMNEHGNIISRCLRLADAITGALGTDTRDQDGDGGEILEFMPEGGPADG